MLLAWPIPLWLQRASWPSRAPGAALILWQAIGISGGLALVTAPLTWGLQPFGSGILSGVCELWRMFQQDGLNGVATDSRWHPLGLAAVTLGCLLFAHLTLVLLHTGYRTFIERKKHRDFVQVLSASLKRHDYGLENSSQSAQNTLVLPVDHPIAYCLPAINRPMTVVSQGLLDELSPDELSAVLTHEAAHLSQRHDLLRVAFQAWHKAVPWLPVTRVAVAEVTDLTELLADDAALIKHHPRDLTTALARTVNEQADSTAPGAASLEPERTANSRRLTRLLHAVPPLSTAQIGLVITLAILLVVMPAIISLS